MNELQIGVVSGGRADYGVLKPLLRLLDDAPDLAMTLIVTGGHLAPEFGNTVRTIEQDGFAVAARIEILLASDTAVGVAKSMGLAVISFAETFDRLGLDALLLMGDRFELLAAAQAALVLGLPIIHIAGGDVTVGAYDDAIRHSITKMSHLHLVTHEAARRRVIQLGEHPDWVHTVGSPALDGIRQVEMASPPELHERVGLRPDGRNLLVTYHPTTLGSMSPADELAELLAALDEFPDAATIITRPNQDNGGRAVIETLDRYAATRDNVQVHSALGQRLYLSTMARCDAVVGNSSSGLYEAPFLRVPTVNIGDRQTGRPRADSVIDCVVDRKSIADAISRAFERDCSKTVSVYGDGHSAARIVELIRTHGPELKHRLSKTFIDIAGRDGG